MFVGLLVHTCLGTYLSVGSDAQKPILVTARGEANKYRYNVLQ